MRNGQKALHHVITGSWVMFGRIGKGPVPQIWRMLKYLQSDLWTPTVREEPTRNPRDALMVRQCPRRSPHLSRGTRHRTSCNRELLPVMVYMSVLDVCSKLALEEVYLSILTYSRIPMWLSVGHQPPSPPPPHPQCLFSSTYLTPLLTQIPFSLSLKLLLRLLFSFRWCIMS